MKEELFTVKETAEKLRMSEMWVRKQTQLKKIRYINLGSRVFIPQSTIDAILTDGTVEPE